MTPPSTERRARRQHGAADAVVPVTRIEEATAGLSRHTLRVIPDTGHGVCMTHVEPFLLDLLDDDHVR